MTNPTETKRAPKLSETMLGCLQSYGGYVYTVLPWTIRTEAALISRGLIQDRTTPGFGAYEPTAAGWEVLAPFGLTPPAPAPQAAAEPAAEPAAPAADEPPYGAVLLSAEQEEQHYGPLCAAWRPSFTGDYASPDGLLCRDTDYNVSQALACATVGMMNNAASQWLDVPGALQYMHREPRTGKLLTWHGRVIEVIVNQGERVITVICGWPTAYLTEMVGRDIADAFGWRFSYGGYSGGWQGHGWTECAATGNGRYSATYVLPPGDAPAPSDETHEDAAVAAYIAEKKAFRKRVRVAFGLDMPEPAPCEAAPTPAQRFYAARYRAMCDAWLPAFFSKADLMLALGLCSVYATFQGYPSGHENNAPLMAALLPFGYDRANVPHAFAMVKSEPTALFPHVYGFVEESTAGALAAIAEPLEPDAQCSNCYSMFVSGDGHPTYALCKRCGFCPDCGKALRHRYPGNDPENGPAALRCPKGCISGEPCEFCDSRWHEDVRPTPQRAEPHDSYGNGLPEVDAENDALMAALYSDTCDLWRPSFPNIAAALADAAVIREKAFPRAPGAWYYGDRPQKGCKPFTAAERAYLLPFGYDRTATGRVSVSFVLRSMHCDSAAFVVVDGYNVYRALMTRLSDYALARLDWTTLAVVPTNAPYSFEVYEP